MEYGMVREVMAECADLGQQQRTLLLLREDVKLSCSGKPFTPHVGLKDFLDILSGSAELRAAFLAEIGRQEAAVRVDLDVVEKRIADWK